MKQEINVLFVDNNDMYCFLVKEFIDKFNQKCENFNINYHSSSDPDLVIKNKLHRGFDIMIVEYFMPTMRGDLFVKQVKSDPKHTVNVFIGSSTKEDLVFDGVDYFLSKNLISKLCFFKKRIQGILNKEFQKAKERA